jgi:hypothetical protein
VATLVIGWESCRDTGFFMKLDIAATQAVEAIWRWIPGIGQQT